LDFNKYQEKFQLMFLREKKGEKGEKGDEKKGTDLFS